MNGRDEQTTAGLPSLDVIAARVAAERDKLTGHAESLDSKAGIALGFAGVIVALRGGRPASWPGLVGLVLTVVAALFAVLAFAPRPFPTLELRQLRDRYLRVEPSITRLRVLDSEVQMVQVAATELKRKARLLRLSLVLLLAGVGCIATGILVAELREVVHG